MKMLIIAIMFLAGSVFGDLIPVQQWPRVVNLPGKQVVNPTVDQCVQAGYRLLEAKPATPEGKVIDNQKIIQDPENPEKAIYEIVYKDKPEVVSPPPPPPPVITNIPADRVQFSFSTNGVYYGAIWLDAPKTNTVEK